MNEEGGASLWLLKIDMNVTAIGYIHSCHNKFYNNLSYKKYEKTLLCVLVIFYMTLLNDI